MPLNFFQEHWDDILPAAVALTVGLVTGARWKKQGQEKRLEDIRDRVERVSSAKNVADEQCILNRSACNTALLEKFNEFVAELKAHTGLLMKVQDLFDRERVLSELNSRSLFELTLTVKLLGERLDAYILTGRSGKLVDKYGHRDGLNSG